MTPGSLLHWVVLFTAALALSARVGAEPDSAKHLDPNATHAGALIMSDPNGSYLMNASCVAIHPRVVLTVAHADPKFAANTYLASHEVSQRLSLSFEANFRENQNRIAVEPNQFFHSPAFTGGGSNAEEVDLAVIILEQPLSPSAWPALPKAGAWADMRGTKVQVTGYGMHRPPARDVPFIPLQTDGSRRTDNPRIHSVANSGWLAIGGQAQTGDSGSPVTISVDGQRVLVGLVSQARAGGGSWITRLDNAEVLAWLRQIGAEHGITL